MSRIIYKSDLEAHKMKSQRLIIELKIIVSCGFKCDQAYNHHSNALGHDLLFIILSLILKLKKNSLRGQFSKRKLEISYSLIVTKLATIIVMNWFTPYCLYF